MLLDITRVKTPMLTRAVGTGERSGSVEEAQLRYKRFVAAR